jgi:hypothetical protein
MQRLHYTGDSILVSDDVCAAILDLARALAVMQVSEVVKVPIVDEAGSLTEAELLIGPASQLYATPAADVSDIAVDPGLVDQLRRRIAELEMAHSATDISGGSTPSSRGSAEQPHSDPTAEA